MTFRPTSALVRAVLMTVVPLACAVLFGRVDLAVLAAPFALGTALALHRRPRAGATIRLTGGEGRLLEGDTGTLELAVTNHDQMSYDLVLAKVPASPDVVIRHGGTTLVLPADGGRKTTLTLPVELARWGRPRVDPCTVKAVACDGLLVSTSVSSEPFRLKVYPRSEAFEADDAMPHATGLVGVHRSRRYGDGGELADIRRYAPGDRLRRIDWRTSLRARELHVVQTLSDRDADLAVVLDVLHDAGGVAGSPGASAPTVLDQTTRIAAAIAEHYLGRGDRVALAEYGGRGRVLRPASGPRHRIVTLEWLLDVQSGERRFGPSELPRGRALVPDRALVVVLTPLLDPRSLAMVADLARSRPSVVAVDTLPADARPVRPGKAGRWAETAYALWMLERRNTIDRLLEHGIPVVSWSGAGSLDQVLRTMSRMAATR